MLTLSLGSEKPSYDWVHLYETYSRLVRPDFRVLEIGCSVPWRTELLAKQCASVLGVEYFPDRVPVSRDNIQFIQGDWQKLTQVVERNSIDLALASHVIEHVEDDLGSLNELYEVLKPGGVAIMTTPNRKRLTRVIIELYSGERKFPWWEHVREYVEADLRAVLSKSSFKRFEVKPIAFGLHGGAVRAYFRQVPQMVRGYANFWEIHAWKEPG